MAEALVPDALRDSALLGLHRELDLVGVGASAGALRIAFSKVLHDPDASYQVRSTHAPSENHRIAMVLDYAKVQGILRTMRKRLPLEPSIDARFQVALMKDVGAGAVEEGIKLVNDFASFFDFPVSHADRVLWSARAADIEAVLDAVDRRSDATPTIRAERLRDVLGLVQIEPGPRDPQRFLVLFTSGQTVVDIRAGRTQFLCARPSTFDGFDNRRFCQRHLESWESGWGMTIDLAERTCAVGLREMVLNPLALHHFRCEYVGELKGSRFGNDEEYLALLGPSPPLAETLADALDARAMALP